VFAPRRRRNNGGTAPNKIRRARHNPGILPSTPRVFAANGIKTNVPDLVTELEITPARLSLITGWCNSLLAAMDAADAAKAGGIGAFRSNIRK